ncbi:hypothetical protein BJY01DRAFT_202565 [Aspergillus pseudoustus]|uniref:Xylanolytic transcriptional activator regulatory domain-containing protein n=1 Tax=Aspergillus pseudoustus TaxID=1810923 RepID=A0ABR4KZL8_9EURO
MHWDLSQAAVSKMAPGERRRFRRIWCVLFQLDVLSSIHHGRPTMISPDSCDQPLPTEDDYVDILGDSFSACNVHFCMQQARLCEILVGIMRLLSPGAVKRFRAGTQSFQNTMSENEASLLSVSGPASPNVRDGDVRYLLLEPPFANSLQSRLAYTPPSDGRAFHRDCVSRAASQVAGNLPGRNLLSSRTVRMGNCNRRHLKPVV